MMSRSFISDVEKVELNLHTGQKAASLVVEKILRRGLNFWVFP